MSSELVLEMLGSFISRGCLLVLSLFIITHASNRVVKEEKESTPEAEESVQNLSLSHVIAFPIIGSTLLLVMFYFFEYIQILLSLLTFGLSVATIFVFLNPFMYRLLSNIHSCHYQHVSGVFTVDWPMLLSICVALCLSITWLFTDHWLLLDLVGVASATFMIVFVRIPSLKVATIFLLLLLCYDVFWVFMSSSIFDTNVMVDVAEKKAKNPVALVAKRMNMPILAQSQPSLALPGKLIIPSSFSYEAYSILGLGDVVLPGMLLCLVKRFDSLLITSTDNTSHLTRRTYFSVCVVGYSIGLLLATLMVELFQYPQPALLYLVPCVLIPLFMKSYAQGHLSSLWKGSFKTISSLPVTRQQLTIL